MDYRRRDRRRADPSSSTSEFARAAAAAAALPGPAVTGDGADDDAPQYDEFGRVIDRQDVIKRAKDRDRERERERERERDRERLQALAEARRAARGGVSSSDSESDAGDTDSAAPSGAAAADADEDLSALDPEEQMRRMMGFGGFDTTKEKKHANVSAANVHKPPVYRQYMNRRGGFNRPLSPKRQ
ncbi:hypothetical protein H9P43_009866 [Blastocladiella emersonii ATCC 22665]|nr:hypothetical protein H9P43_009866 [Blastocladiella emersonii ATCC 22665]